jgi:hypothetical protein
MKRLILFAIMVFAGGAGGEDSFYVWEGVEQSIAAIIQVRNGTLDPATVVGDIDGNRLTARRLVELYDRDSLTVGEIWVTPTFSGRRVDWLLRLDRQTGIFLSSIRRVEPFRNLRSFRGGVENLIYRRLTRLRRTCALLMD